MMVANRKNLGAIALIKRGIKNIIISDAEMDPNYIFDGYFKLKNELEKHGYSFEEMTFNPRAASNTIISEGYLGVGYRITYNRGKKKW